MAVVLETKAGTDRRDRFREYMRRLNPTAPARAVLDLGLVVKKLQGNLHENLAARADLEPRSQQLLVGGIGSGKTTELLLAEQWLSERSGSLPLYIDISAETDLSELNTGALIAGFGLHLARASKRLPDELQSTIRKACNELRDFALGKTKTGWVSYPEPDYFEEPDEPDDEPGHFVVQSIPGKLSPPFPPLQRDIKGIRDPLETLVKAQNADPVAIFDGLDRLISPDRFWSVVHQDLRLLKELGVAVVAAAPLSVLYGGGRQVSEHFDRVHHIATVRADPGHTSKLRSVLKHRGASALTTSANIDRICAVSGGVLRDLVTVARDAGELAYLDGSDTIKSKHIDSAGGQLGGAYLRGLGQVQKSILRRLAHLGSFDVSSSNGIELLVTRRVLEYEANDFRVHPALWPLIDPKAKAKHG